MLAIRLERKCHIKEHVHWYHPKLSSTLNRLLSDQAIKIQRPIQTLQNAVLEAYEKDKGMYDVSKYLLNNITAISCPDVLLLCVNKFAVSKSFTHEF